MNFVNTLGTTLIESAKKVPTALRALFSKLKTGIGNSISTIKSSGYFQFLEICSVLLAVLGLCLLWPWWLDMRIVDVRPILVLGSNSGGIQQKGTSFIVHLQNPSWRAVRLSGASILGRLDAPECFEVIHFGEQLDAKEAQKYFFQMSSADGFFENDQSFPVIEPGDEAWVKISFAYPTFLRNNDFINLPSCCYQRVDDCTKVSKIDWKDVIENNTEKFKLRDEWTRGAIGLYIEIGPKIPISILGRKNIFVPKEKLKNPLSVSKKDWQDVSAHELSSRDGFNDP